MGFLGWMGVVIAERLYTLALWEDPAAIRQIAASATHQAAVRQAFGPDFGAAMHTGIWVPDHLNPRWHRCWKCGTLIDPDRPDASCPCGEPLPPRHANFWVVGGPREPAEGG